MRKAITGLATVALLAGIALVAVSLGETPSATAQETEDQVFNQPLDGVLDGLVDGGVITADQRDKIAAAFEERFVRFGKSHRGTPRLDTVAEALGIGVDELAASLKAGSTVADIAGDKIDEVIAALVAEQGARLDAAVADGRLTEQEADEVRAALADQITAMVNGDGRIGLKPFGSDHFQQREGFGFRGNFGLDQIAEDLGLSGDELRESLAGGSTLAEIADENGVATDTLVDTLLADLDEKLDALVADERLTRERADDIREGSAAMIESMINGEMPGLDGFKFHHGEKFHGRGMPGPGGFFGPEDEIDGADTAA